MLHGFGLIPTLVGGTPRDYVMHSVLGHDWDIELFSPTVTFNKDLWKELGKALGSIGKVVILPYEVIRLDMGPEQYEFSPPRSETFFTDWEDKGHSNFDAHYDLKLPFEMGVKRRDFTINSIGFRFHNLKEVEVLDPLDGIRHIHEKVLHPAGKDFEKDPLRFFRAVRFAKNLGFEFSSELKIILNKMKIKNIPAVHLWSEMQKSKDPVGYYIDLLHYKNVHPEMGLPVGEEVISKREELSRILKDPTRHEMWMVALEWVGLSCGPWQTFFSISGDSCKRLSRWAKSTKDFIKIDPETFQGEFEAIRELPEFESLFDWYFTTKQILQKNPDLPLMNMIHEFAPAWVHLYRFEVVKDVKHIDPPFRAKYQVWNLCQRI